MRMANSVALSPILRTKWRRMFSTKVVVGASSVADAQDLMADNSAPKNTTCMKNGIFCITSVGSTFCGSSAISALVCSGITISAVATRKIGTAANRMYMPPPITGPQVAARRFFADITRWNTSCCGIEPSIMVMAAAKKKTMSCQRGSGRKRNRFLLVARSMTGCTPPAMSLAK